MSRRDVVCDLVAERVALGEPVGEADHVAGCERCQRTIALPARLAHAHAGVDPGLGFSARITVGARQRIAIRKRRRVAGGIAATALASALGVVIVGHPTTGSPIHFPVPVDQTSVQTDTHDKQLPPDKDPWPSNPTSGIESLLRLADTDHASHLGADWASIERPLAPYRTLIKGVKP